MWNLIQMLNNNTRIFCAAKYISITCDLLEKNNHMSSQGLRGFATFCDGHYRPSTKAVENVSYFFL